MKCFRRELAIIKMDFAVLPAREAPCFPILIGNVFWVLLGNFSK